MALSESCSAIVKQASHNKQGIAPVSEGNESSLTLILRQREGDDPEVSSARTSQAFGGGPAGLGILLASGEDFIAISPGGPIGTPPAGPIGADAIRPSEEPG